MENEIGSKYSEKYGISLNEGIGSGLLKKTCKIKICRSFEEQKLN